MWLTPNGWITIRCTELDLHLVGGAAGRAAFENNVDRRGPVIVAVIRLRMFYG